MTLTVEKTPEEVLAELKSAMALDPATVPPRVTRLTRALTTDRGYSRYADWNDDEVRETLAAVNEVNRDVKAALAKSKADRPQVARPSPTVSTLLADPLQMHLDLFEDKGRWPKKPYCSDDKSARHVRSLVTALRRPYIQANPPYMRIWSIYDVDRPAGAIAWEDADLPPPSWASANKANGHAHLVWGLKAPVLVDSPDMRQAPLRYLCAVEAAFREKLEADQGYAGLITKNPAHPLWHTLRGPMEHYDLGDLAEFVDLKYAPKRKPPEQVGLGRNVHIFDQLRKRAYREIRHYKREVRNFVLWQSHLNFVGLTLNGELHNPLDPVEVWHIAKSVSKWTWRKFDLDASDARFSALQSHRGKLGGRPSLGEPWEKMGLSRATYFRRRASGLIVPSDAVDNASYPPVDSETKAIIR